MQKPFVLICVLLAAGPLCCAQSNRRDGNWWIGKPASDKLDYMTGFFDGMELGNRFSYWELSKSTSKTCSGEATRLYAQNSEKFLANVTNGQLVDGLDAFYKDYRNRRIKIHDAVWLVVNGIAGTPHEELDKMIESWREHAID